MQRRGINLGKLWKIVLLSQGDNGENEWPSHIQVITYSPGDWRNSGLWKGSSLKLIEPSLPSFSGPVPDSIALLFVPLCWQKCWPLMEYQSFLIPFNSQKSHKNEVNVKAYSVSPIWVAVMPILKWLPSQIKT